MLPLDRPTKPAPDSVMPLELWAERLARLILLLTALADRYDDAGPPTATSAQRASRRRTAIQTGRRALTAVALGPGPDPALTPAGSWPSGRAGDQAAAADTAGQDLRQRLAADAVVAQAQGMLMHRHRIDPAQALGLLRATARESGVTVAVCAQDMVNAVSSPGGYSASWVAPGPHQI